MSESKLMALREDETVRLVTEAMREADEHFERCGGSTRHHVRDCLMPALEKRGLVVARESASTTEPAAADPQLWSELNNLVELVQHSAPLTWAASGDMAGAGDWERQAEKLLARVVALQSKTLPAEHTEADRAALDHLLAWAGATGNTAYRIGETYYASEDNLPLLSADDPAELVAALEQRSLASASPDRYPDRPAEVAAPPGEQLVILRCKRRKVPGDGGVVDGCGWQGPAPRVSCPSCGSPLLRPLPAPPKGTP